MSYNAGLDQIAEASRCLAADMFALMSKDQPPIMMLGVAIELLAITIAHGSLDGKASGTIREVMRALPGLVHGHLSKTAAERKP